MSKKYTKKRIYICHTFYHVYVSYLKELNLPSDERGQASIILSRLSNNFGDIASRIEQSGIFEAVYEFDEKPYTYFDSLTKWKKDYGNTAVNMLSRIIFTKKFGRLQSKYVPVNLRDYKDIYVYCDADPIGYYLSVHHIKYHALEDGLDTLADCVEAIYDNRDHFKLKKFMSEKLNLIFIRDGYNKYCIDIEVNSIAKIRFPYEKYVEVSRSALADNLTKEDKELLLGVFIRDYDTLKVQIKKLDSDSTNILILTEPLCDLVTRKKIFTDLIATYGREGNVFLKPHPRDEMDYRVEFPETLSFDGSIPMEVFNFLEDFRFSKVISVYTHITDIRFADEAVVLGHDFMDKYEDPDIHRKDEKI